jgi:hypothetical protein
VKLFASLAVFVGRLFCIQEFNDRVSAWLRIVVAGECGVTTPRDWHALHGRSRQRAQVVRSAATELLLCDETNAAVAAH